MSEGSALHFFNSLLRQVQRIQADIQRSCIQRGNFCVTHRCALLEPIVNCQFSCGSYNSNWRRISSCGSVPLKPRNIDRYACQSHFIVKESAIRLSKLVPRHAL
jgi:hypothetical protein